MSIITKFTDKIIESSFSQEFNDIGISSSDLDKRVNSIIKDKNEQKTCSSPRKLLKPIAIKTPPSTPPRPKPQERRDSGEYATLSSKDFKSGLFKADFEVSNQKFKLSKKNRRDSGKYTQFSKGDMEEPRMSPISRNSNSPSSLSERSFSPSSMSESDEVFTPFMTSDDFDD